MISVTVATFGSEEWRQRGDGVFDTLQEQTLQPRSAHRVHGLTLALARNQGAEEAKGEWLLFLDADDYLERDYIESMAARIESLPSNDYLIRPACKSVDENCDPYVHPEKDIRQSNFMIIGTIVRRDQFLRVGGFRELPLLEDWDLWIRCVRDGAKYESCPDAVYHVGLNEERRNFPGQQLEMEAYRQIQRTYGFR